MELLIIFLAVGLSLLYLLRRFLTSLKLPPQQGCGSSCCGCSCANSPEAKEVKASNRIV
jgi:hypothetical protein